jgi:hypothetical protein
MEKMYQFLGKSKSKEKSTGALQLSWYHRTILHPETVKVSRSYNLHIFLASNLL